MNLWNAALPILGILVGAFATYVGTNLHERARARDDLKREWALRRRDSYLNYLLSIKAMRIKAAELAAFHGWDDEANPRDPCEGVQALVDADNARSSAQEAVNMYGDSNAIRAARDLTDTAWGLEWIARGRHPQASPQLWNHRMDEYSKAIDAFIRAARADIATPGNYVDRRYRLVHESEQSDALLVNAETPVEDRTRASRTIGTEVVHLANLPEQLLALAELHRAGKLNEAEFAAAKAKLLR